MNKKQNKKMKKKKKEKERIMRELWEVYNDYYDDWEDAFYQDFNNVLNSKDQELNWRKEHNKNKTYIYNILYNGFIASYIAHLTLYNINDTDSISIKKTLNDKEIWSVIRGVRYGKTLNQRLNRINNEANQMLENSQSKYENKDIGLLDFYNELLNIKNKLHHNYERLINTEFSNTINQAADIADETIIEILNNDFELIDEEKIRLLFNTKITRQDIGVKTYEELVDEVGVVRADLSNGTIDELYKYNAVLDEKTCNDCYSLHGKLFKKDEAPEVPQHPYCRCYYDTEFIIHIGYEMFFL